MNLLDLENRITKRRRNKKQKQKTKNKKLGINFMNLHSRFHTPNLVIVAGWYHCYWYKISLNKEKDNCFLRFVTLLPLLWICSTLAVAATPPLALALWATGERLGTGNSCGVGKREKAKVQLKKNAIFCLKLLFCPSSKTREAREVGTNQMQKMQKKKRNKIKEKNNKIF
jgi:hypothetical protein